MGDPQNLSKCLVYFMENPNLEMDDPEVPPWLRKPAYHDIVR